MNSLNTSNGKTKTSLIANALRNAIIFGDLKPGEKLTESRIADRFSTSHIPVREALKQLEREGFIEHKAYSANNVRRTSESNLNEYNSIHKIFIKNYLRQAMKLYTAKDISKLESIATKMSKCKDYREASLLLIDLNEMLYAPLNMPYMSSMLKKLFLDNLMHLSIFFKEISKEKVNVDYIFRFLKLCRKKKFNEAVSFWVKVQDESTKVLIKHFKTESANRFSM